ncbi:MAG: hypothetical protein Q8916_08610 [Bacteroidota bacterium]|nr:hypothetical protein [Bacteroidota bacterium]MDP4237592.1 hypothetical protein [Bacteroidota bacterium]
MKYLILLAMFSPALACDSFAQFTADSSRPKPIGSVIRTVREIDMTNDTVPEVLQVETTRAKRFRDIKVRFGIYRGKKNVYSYSWKADDFFDKIDKLPDTIKWFRLQRIMRGFFSNQNFSSSDSEDLSSLFGRLRAADIKPGTDEAREFTSAPHKIFSVYAGRDMLFGITWLDSKKRFVTLWRN